MADITDSWNVDSTNSTGSNDQVSAWMMARLGNAIDVSIDRVLNKPQLAYDAGQAYGIDQNGNLYQLGTQNRVGGSNVVAGMSPNLLLLLVVGFVIYAASK